MNWLAGRDDVDERQLGIVGWGWGGAYALMAAAHDARIRVAVDIGGDVTYPVLTAQKPGSPLNFVGDIEGALFAAFPENDPQIPRNEIERLRFRIIDHDKRGEVKVYPNTPPHFWRDESLPQTQLLWRRVEAFLGEHIAEQEAWGEGYPNEESRLHA